MNTINKYTLYVGLLFLVIGCSSKRTFYHQQIEAPIASNIVPFDLFAYKQDTAITITTPRGTSIKIEPNSFVHSNGKIVTNQIIIKIREMHSAVEIFKSGIPMSIDSVRNNFLQSGGMFEIRAFDNDEELKIANGKSIDVALANFLPANGYSLYHLNGNENWKVSDTFVLKQNEHKANGLDKIFKFLKQPFTRKSIPANNNYLLVANLKEVPHLKAFQNQQWNVLNTTDPKTIEMCKRLSWDDVVITPVKSIKNLYNLSFTRAITVFGSGTDTVSVTVQATPANIDDTAFENQLVDYKNSIAKLNDEKIRLQAEADMVSSFKIKQMGVWNIDRIMKSDEFVSVSAKFDFEKSLDPLINHVKLFVLFEEDNSVIYYMPQDWNKIKLSRTKRNSIVAVLSNDKVAVVDAKEVNAKLTHGNQNIYFNTVERSASSFK
jgi:hypothetical protein